MKNIAIFGATGKTGAHVSKLALEKGYQVTVFGRSARDKFDPELYRIVAGDVGQQADVVEALKGQDGAIVCFGPTSLKDAEILAQGTENIATAMAEQGANRVLFLSAAGAKESRRNIPFTSKLLFKTLLKSILKGHEDEEDIFASGTLDWTAVRAAVLTQKPSKGSVRAGFDIKPSTITREDLAKFLVEQLDDQTYSRKAVLVSN